MTFKKWMILAFIVALGIFFASENEHFSSAVKSYIENSEIMTLEARFSPDQIMETRKKELLGNDERKFQSSELKFYPYALLEVKYLLSDKKTKEGVILWGLVDGEMVISTDNFEKSHGFEDAINADATPDDFKILNALGKSNGKMGKEQLQKTLGIDDESLEALLSSVKQKQLVVMKGSEAQLHFQDPKISLQPQTKFTQWLVSKPYSHSQRISRKYTTAQVKKIAKAAFGQDFTIRNVEEVFLPVYRIDVLNPDGSTMSSYWNAVTGARIQPNYLN